MPLYQGIGGRGGSLAARPTIGGKEASACGLGSPGSLKGLESSKNEAEILDRAINDQDCLPL